MDDARRARYLAKAEHAAQRLEQFQAWSPEAGSSDVHRLAAYKALQEVAEALLDVVAMRVKDIGHAPADDYTNVDRLERNGDLPPAACAALRELNGLRNRLVHEYNGLWDQVALDSADRLAEGLPTVLEVMASWSLAA